MALAAHLPEQALRHHLPIAQVCGQEPARLFRELEEDHARLENRYRLPVIARGVVDDRRHSVIRNSWVTLKRVVTNQPEKITKEGVAQMNLAVRRPSKATVPSATTPVIGAVRLLATVQAGRSDRSASRIASSPRRFL
jgi:hypothetical protein